MSCDPRRGADGLHCMLGAGLGWAGLGRMDKRRALVLVCVASGRGDDRPILRLNGCIESLGRRRGKGRRPAPMAWLRDRSSLAGWFGVVLREWPVCFPPR